MDCTRWWRDQIWKMAAHRKDVESIVTHLKKWSSMMIVIKKDYFLWQPMLKILKTALPLCVCTHMCAPCLQNWYVDNKIDEAKDAIPQHELHTTNLSYVWKQACSFKHYIFDNEMIEVDHESTINKKSRPLNIGGIFWVVKVKKDEREKENTCGIRYVSCCRQNTFDHLPIYSWIWCKHIRT